MTVVFATLGFTPQKLLAALPSVSDVRKVIFYTSHSPAGRDKSEKAEQEVVKVLNQLGIDYRSVVLDSPWNFIEIFRSMLKDLSRVSDNIVFNLTGGPKTMTVAATMASILLGIPLVYFPEEEEVRLQAIHLPVLNLAYTSLLTDGQRRVLREVEKRGGQARSADIHRTLGISSPTLEYHVKRLEKLGVIRVEPMEEDRRHRLIEITQSGELILLSERYAIGNERSV